MIDRKKARVLLRITALRNLGKLTEQEVLKEINDHPNIGYFALKKNLMMAQSTLSRVLNKLLNEGMVLKSEESNDRRFVHYSLTELGRMEVEK